jgi:non-heme chloroperoxidase
MGRAKPHYGVAFSQNDLAEELKTITAPVLVMHGDDCTMRNGLSSHSG